MLLRHVGGEAKISIDTDWVCRKLLPVTARFVRDIGSLTWRAAVGVRIDRMHWVMVNQTHFHGPKGILASTWPTGSMVLWVAASAFKRSKRSVPVKGTGTGRAGALVIR